jgi:hypothetical protein
LEKRKKICNFATEFILTIQVINMLISD